MRIRNTPEQSESPPLPRTVLNKSGQGNWGVPTSLSLSASLICCAINLTARNACSTSGVKLRGITLSESVKSRGERMKLREIEIKYWNNK